MTSLFQAIPAGWHRTSLRRLARGRKNGAWGSEAGEDEFDAVCVRVADFDWSRLTLKLDDPTVRSFKKQQFRNLKLLPGDILIEKSGGGEKTPVGRVVSFDESVDAVTSNFVARIRTHDNVRNRYFLYLLAAHYMSGFSHQFIKQNTGIQNLDDTNLFRSDVWVPDLETQKAIADFLDRETARIDQLIEKKRAFVSALEARQEGLARLLLSGETTESKLRQETSTPWLKSVPSHWNIVPLRHLVRISTGGRDTQDRLDDGDYPFYVRSMNVERIDTYSFDEEAVLTSGDGAGVGKVFHHVQEKFELHQRMYAFTRFKMVSGRYFFHYLKTFFHLQMTQWSAKSTVDSVRMPFLKSLLIAVPSIKEQQSLLIQLDTSQSRMHAIVGSTLKSIERLQEFRAAIITATVTGQIDVTTWGRKGTTDGRLYAIEAEMEKRATRLREAHT